MAKKTCTHFEHIKLSSHFITVSLFYANTNETGCGHVFLGSIAAQTHAFVIANNPNRDHGSVISFVCADLLSLYSLVLTGSCADDVGSSFLLYPRRLHRGL
jgi:hypothetical protein